MDKPNIILIVCDTLRKDVLELYGGEAKTPNLNKLAKDAMVYDNAIAPSPWTFPSHVSLFTGLYPSEHGVHETDKLKLYDLAPLNEELQYDNIPRYLKRLGYSTIGISNNIMVSRFTHFDKEFDFFLNLDISMMFNEKVEVVRKLGVSKIHAARTLIKQKGFNEFIKYTKEYLRVKALEKALNYPFDKGGLLTNNIIYNNKFDSRFFLFVNLMETHEPYIEDEWKEIIDNLTNIKAISSSKVKNIKERYKYEAEYIDRNIGELIVKLKERGFYDNTIIIITSDHGQAFNEYDYMYHGNYLYDEIITIPLIIKYPKNKKFRKIKGYQSLINIMPLLKDILNGKDDKKLTSNTAFAESFGAELFLNENYKNRKNYYYNKYEKQRKAVYKDGFKLTINGSDCLIEEFLKGSKNKNPNQYKYEVRKLIKELKKFNKDKNFEMPNV